MATNTPVLQLRKPAGLDNVDVVADLNDNWDKVEAATVSPHYQGTYPATSIVHSAWTLVGAPTTVSSLDVALSGGTRVTPAKAGWYSIVVTLEFSANSTANRGAAIVKNGAGAITVPTIIGLVNVEASSGAGETTMVQVAALEYFNGTTDYVEVFGRQLSGGALALNTAAGSRTNCIKCVRVGL